MSVIIPIRPLAASSVPAERAATAGPLLPFRFGGAAANTVEQREVQALRAVAAAAAVYAPGQSLALARDVQTGAENPGTLFDAIDPDDVGRVLNEVRRIQADRTGAPGPNDTQRLVAAAVGADPVLVATALAKMADDVAAATAAREWAAANDAVLLERAARAATRRKFLDPGKPVDTVTELRKTVDDHETRLSKIEHGGKAGAQPALRKRKRRK